MSSPITLIVGLGNPGTEYENTRHNAGAWFVHALAHLAKTSLQPQKKYHGLHAAIKLGEHECHLLIPTTFMNLSGQSVQALAHYYKINSHAILIAHDEIDLPVGDIRLKLDGGHGGHNGLRDIIDHLNTREFYRLRIGVGRPGTSKEVVDYVLKPPKKSEREMINESIEKALTVLPEILAGKMQRAMHALHTIPKT